MAGLRLIEALLLAGTAAAGGPPVFHQGGQGIGEGYAWMTHTQTRPPSPETAWPPFAARRMLSPFSE